MRDKRSILRHSKLTYLRRLSFLFIARKEIIQNYIKNYSQQQESNEDEDDQDYEPMMEVPDIPYQLLHLLPAKERKSYQKQFPNLPPYIFMNKEEKKKYFQKKGTQYQSKLSKAPLRKSKSKKIVKFRQNYDVRPFVNSQKAIKVGETKSFRDSYRNEHFSSP